MELVSELESEAWRCRGGAGATPPYLHAAQSHSQRGRRALFALLHLPGGLLLRGVVSVLPGAHLQVQDAGVGEVVDDVLQQQELWLERSRQGRTTLRSLLQTATTTSVALKSHRGGERRML